MGEIYFLLLFSLIIVSQACTFSTKQVKVNSAGNSLSSNDIPITSLSNGNFLAGYLSSSTTKLRIYNSSGTTQGSEISFSSASRPCTASLSGYFVVAYVLSQNPYFKIYNNSGTLQKTVTVSTNFGGNYAKVAALKNGGFVVAYSVGSSVYCVIYNNTGSIKVAGKVCNTKTLNGHFTISGLEEGGFVLAYVYLQNVWGGTFNSTLGRVTSDFQMHTTTTLANNGFGVTAISNGGFVLSYYGGTGKVYIVGYYNNGTKIFNETIVGTGSAYCPAVGAYETGGFMVGYTPSAGGSYASLYTNYGTLVQGSSLTSTGTTQDNGAVDFTLTGEAIVGNTYNGDGFLYVVSLSGCPEIYDPNSISISSSSNSSNTNSSNSSNSSNSTNSSNISSQTNITNSSNSSNFSASNYSNITNSTNSTNATNQTNSSVNPPIPPNPNNTKVTNETVYVPPTALASVTTAAAAAVGAAVGSSFISGANPTLMWGFMSFLQQFYYLLFLNVNTPDNLKSFLQMFSFANLDFIPNILQAFQFPKLGSPEKFFKNNFTGLFFESVGSNLEMWVVVIIITCYLTFMRRQSYFSVKFKFALYKSCPIRMWIDSVPPFLFAICLQFPHAGNLSSGLIGFSFFFGLIILICIMLTPYMFYKALVLNKRKSLIFHVLFEDFDFTKRQKKYFPVFEISKKIICVLIIVFAYYTPFLQVLGLAIVNSLYLTTILVLKPRKSRGENHFYLVLEFISCLIHISFSLFHYNLDSGQNESLGYFVIVLILFCVSIGAYPMLKDQFGAFVKLYQRITRQNIKRIEGIKRLRAKNLNHIESMIQDVTGDPTAQNKKNQKVPILRVIRLDNEPRDVAQSHERKTNDRDSERTYLSPSEMTFRAKDSKISPKASKPRGKRIKTLEGYPGSFTSIEERLSENSEGNTESDHKIMTEDENRKFKDRLKEISDRVYLHPHQRSKSQKTIKVEPVNESSLNNLSLKEGLKKKPPQPEIKLDGKYLKKRGNELAKFVDELQLKKEQLDKGLSEISDDDIIASAERGSSSQINKDMNKQRSESLEKNDQVREEIIIEDLEEEFDKKKESKIKNSSLKSLSNLIKADSVHRIHNFDLD